MDLFPSSFRDDHTQPDLDGYSLLTSLTLSRVSFPSVLLPGVQQSPFRAVCRHWPCGNVPTNCTFCGSWHDPAGPSPLSALRD
ncbi:hypothetical protein BJX66DRAFT_320249, partial [Aspergillus keveii]